MEGPGLSPSSWSPLSLTSSLSNEPLAEPGMPAYFCHTHLCNLFKSPRMPSPKGMALSHCFLWLGASVSRTASAGVGLPAWGSAEWLWLQILFWGLTLSLAVIAKVGVDGHRH